MRVAELDRERHFRLIDQDIPEPSPGEVQVRVHSVGLCGSDRHYYLEGHIGGAEAVYPVVPGHEPTGTVVRTGAGVSGWQPGDLAALEPAIYCNECEFCRGGHHNVCANIRFFSMPPDPGFLREYVNLPVSNLLPLPPEVGPRVGTLFEPLAVVLHSLRLAQFSRGERAIVFGAGPIGLLTIAALRLAGAGRIWSVEPVPVRRELALALGASCAMDLESAPVRQVLNDTGFRGVDVAFDCAGARDTVNQSIEATRNAGRVVITGIASDSRSALDLHTARRKELTLLNVRRSNHEAREAIEVLKERSGLFAPMLTHDLPLDQVGRAFQMLETYEDGPAKITIRI